MKVLKSLLVVGASALLTSCAMVQSPVNGSMMTNVKAPLAVTGNSGSSKVGTGEVKSILGIIASGDASIQKAAKEAGITKIHHVDYEAKSLLGITASYKVFVYGE